MLINRGILPSRPSEIVSAAENFLHHVNIDSDAALFFPTSTVHLREASFLDGRTPLANGPAEAIAIVDTVRNLLPSRRPLGRYLFNMSFCGSTYIARLLDAPGRALALKEPRSFTDMAAWKTLRIRNTQDISAMRPALDLVRAIMFREHIEGERVVVKPACWANNILDELVGSGDLGLALLVTIDRRGFLRAVFRGGQARVDHTLSLAWHMATLAPDGDAMLATAREAAKGDPRLEAAKLTLVAHGLQKRVFERALRRGGWSGDRIIAFDDLVDHPLDTAVQAASLLDLDLSRDLLAANVDRLRGRNAKEPSHAFSRAEQRAAEEKFLSPFLPIFDSAERWASDVLGAETNVPLRTSEQVAV